MDEIDLEVWAVGKFAQNKRPNQHWEPVILHRNEKAEGMGAIIPFGSTTRLLTAGHLFWECLPPFHWTYRVLKSEGGIRLPLIAAEPFPMHAKADLAICTPGTILNTSPLLSNFFYQGASWSGELQVNIWKLEKFKQLISTISGEVLTSVGEIVYDGAPYEVLDYASLPGESGTVLWDENDGKTIYILKGDSPVLAKHLRPEGLCQSGKITLALRISENR